MFYREELTPEDEWIIASLGDVAWQATVYEKDARSQDESDALLMLQREQTRSRKAQVGYASGPGGDQILVESARFAVHELRALERRSQEREYTDTDDVWATVERVTGMLQSALARAGEAA